MQKKILVLFIALSVLIVFSACGKNKEQPKTVKQNTEKPITKKSVKIEDQKPIVLVEEEKPKVVETEVEPISPTQNVEAKAPTQPIQTTPPKAPAEPKTTTTTNTPPTPPKAPETPPQPITPTVQEPTKQELINKFPKGMMVYEIGGTDASNEQLKAICIDGIKNDISAAQMEFNIKTYLSNNAIVFKDVNVVDDTLGFPAKEFPKVYKLDFNAYNFTAVVSSGNVENRGFGDCIMFHEWVISYY